MSEPSDRGSLHGQHLLRRGRRRRGPHLEPVVAVPLALAGKVGEVAELVQWLPTASSVDDGLRERLGDELADVLLHLVRLADIAGVDLGQAALAKLSRNEERFPAKAFRIVAPSDADRPSVRR